MKKVLAIFLSLLFLSTFLVACGGDDAPPTGDGDAPAVTDDNGATDDSEVAASGADITFTVLAQPMDKVIDISNNEFTDWLEEQTGVHLDFTVVAQNEDGDQVVAMMMASGEELADILMVRMSYEMQYLYGQQGIIMNLSPLIESYAPNLTQAFVENPMFAATATRLDGNIYYFPKFEGCFHCTASQKMWINRQWLDNLGLPMPTTTEEFNQTLIAFRDGDPNGNGLQDEIPLSGASGGWRPQLYAFLMNAFVAFNGPNDPMSVRDGVVFAPFVTDEWRDGLTWMNQMFREGLIDENAFVQDHSAVMTLTTGETVMLGAIPEGHPAMFVPVDNPNIFYFEAVPPLRGPNGVQYTGHFPSVAKSSCGVAFSSTNHDPVRATQWADFMLTEEATLRQIFGVKGRDWDFNDDPDILGLNDEKALMHTFGQAPAFQTTQTNALWDHTGPALWTDRIFAGLAVIGGDGFDLEKVLFDATFPYVDHFPAEIAFALQYEEEDAQFIAMTRGIMADFITQTASEFIIGIRDITSDADWAQYLAEMDGFGLQQYIETVQRGFDAQQEVLARFR